MTQVSPRAPSHYSKAKFLLVVALVIGLIGIAVAIPSFTQTTPSVVTPSQTLKPICSTLALDTAGSSINPQQGAFEFDCTGQPAIISDGVSATPTFTFPNSLTQCTAGQTTECLTLGISATTCGPGVSVSVITSGSSAAVPKGSFVYCMIYENASPEGTTYGTFSISWS